MPTDSRAVTPNSGSAWHGSGSATKIIVPPAVELSGRWRRLGDANPPAVNRDDRLHFKRLQVGRCKFRIIR